jgi:hypothetical protein
VQFLQLRFGIEKVQLAGSAFHVNENALARFGGEMRRLETEHASGLRRFGRRRKQSIALQQGSESEPADAGSCGDQEVAASQLNDFTRIHSFDVPAGSGELLAKFLKATSFVRKKFPDASGHSGLHFRLNLCHRARAFA